MAEKGKFYMAKTLNILVTGGLGFIGLNLAQELTAGGYSVILFDNLSPQVHGDLPALNEAILTSNQVKVVRGDVTDAAALKTVLQDVQAVVHLAAETGTAQSMYQIAHYNHVNSQGTAILLDILANEPHNVKKLVLASSRSVYGEGAYRCPECGVVYPESRSREQLQVQAWELRCPICTGPTKAVPTAEDARVRPASIYAATKYAQEEMVRIAGPALGIGTVILRFQNVYGRGQSLNNPYTGILSIFSTRIRRRRSLPIFEDGLESRDFVYVTDVARAIRMALESIKADGQVFNVGAGKPTSVLEIANLLVKVLGGNIKPQVTGQYRLGDIRHCYADLSRITNVLGFVPQVSLEEGIAQFARWVLTQPLPEDGLDKANNELKLRRMMDEAS